MAINYDQVIDLLKVGTEFRLLSAPVLEQLAQSLEIREITGGTRIVSEGELDDSMFVVISGRLRVSRRGRDSRIMLYNEILPGECVGELGVILNQPRTADITALRDSVIGVLSQEKFKILLKTYPLEINRTFSQAVYNHLRHTRRIEEQKRAYSFAVIPLSDQVDAVRTAQNLTDALTRMGTTRHVVPSSDEGSAINIDALEADNDFLVYRAETTLSRQTLASFQYADQLLFVANAGTSKKISEIEKKLVGEPGFTLKRKHLAVIHKKKSNLCEDRLEWGEHRDVERICPVCLDELADFERIARFLIGRAVGVVLGGGGARGFAHLGVLRAFEETGIPVDLIGGNSMGALIGACYTYGLRLEDIHKRIMEVAKGIVRFHLPVVSILSGKNFEKALKNFFGDTQVQCLWSTYFAAACNLSRAKTMVLDTGLLWKAVLASNSPAGLLPPIINDGQLTVDGAILENVPVQAMRGRLGTALERRRGNGTIIAIDVDVKEDITVEKSLTALNNWEVLKSSFSSGSPKLPGVKDILTRSSQIGGLAQRQRIISSADYYLEPPVSHFPMKMDHKTAVEIIESGYDYAIEKITQWNLTEKILS